MKKYLIVSFAVILLSASSAFTEVNANEIKLLQMRIIGLEKRVSSQEDRINTLENILNNNNRSTSLTVNKQVDSTSQQKESQWKDSSKWKKVQLRMTEQQIISLLGPPTSKEGNFGTSVKYVYEGEVLSSGYVKGWIDFYENHVISWSGPVFLTP